MDGAERHPTLTSQSHVEEHPGPPWLALRWYFVHTAKKTLLGVTYKGFPEAGSWVGAIL